MYNSIKNQYLIFLLIFLFLFRCIYGLCSEFWFEDELQIYLLGLKSYTTHTWAYYGPDVVYTQTQIPGALQSLLISSALYMCSIPESPTILLNILTFSSLLLLGFYLQKRFLSFPNWLIFSWISLLPWTINYGTRVVNPSYVLIFSVPFFIATIELLEIYEKSIWNKKIAFFTLGFCLLAIMQLHLSFVLLLPFIGFAFYIHLKNAYESLKNKCANLFSFVIGVLVGSFTLIPTLLLEKQTKDVSSNIVVNFDNFKQIFTVLYRYLLFASYDIPYLLGGRTKERLAVIQYNYFITPFALFLLIFGGVLLAAMIYTFVKNKEKGAWEKMKFLNLATVTMVFFSFFFSIKGPSSHTFCIVTPLVIVYSFHCYEWLWEKFKIWKKLMVATVVSAFFFYICLSSYNFHHKSLYKDRQKIQKAIDNKDYRLLGNRREGYLY